jgi:hypothetical protein
MLDPWIIEEIRRREEEEHQRQSERPALEIPMDLPIHAPQGGKPDPDSDRGVTIVDFTI